MILAAAGSSERDYPWGNISPTPDFGNFNNNVGSPTDVGRYPKGATPEGIFDMGGNVWEWCDSHSDYYQTQRVIMGGSWLSTDFCTSNTFVSGVSPNTKRNDIGFRIVRTID